VKSDIKNELSGLTAIGDVYAEFFQFHWSVGADSRIDRFKFGNVSLKVYDVSHFANHFTRSIIGARQPSIGNEFIFSLSEKDQQMTE
jgi:hypothetical protein